MSLPALFPHRTLHLEGWAWTERAKDLQRIPFSYEEKIIVNTDELMYSEFIPMSLLEVVLAQPEF